MSRFVVVAGGPSDDVVDRRLDPDSVVVAADSGADRARRAGWPVHHLVGDLDSVTDAGLDHCSAHGAIVHRHRADKDATDLELALDLAVREGATEIEVVLDPGGRFDHLLVAAHVLASDAYAAVPVRAMVGDAVVTVVRGSRSVVGRVGALLTLLAIGGPARVSTTGLRFPLRGEWLQPTSGRGLSNELTAPAAVIDVADGVVLAIQPASA